MIEGILHVIAGKPSSSQILVPSFLGQCVGLGSVSDCWLSNAPIDTEVQSNAENTERS